MKTGVGYMTMVPLVCQHHLVYTFVLPPEKRIYGGENASKYVKDCVSRKPSNGIK